MTTNHQEPPISPSGINWGRQKSLSREKIWQISDITALKNMLDESTNNCIAISTQLEFSNKDDEWRESAIAALIYNKIDKKNLTYRLEELKRKDPDKSLKEAAI